MAQAGRGKKLRKARGRPHGLVKMQTDAEFAAEMRRVREGVVPGAEAGKEMCPVCSMWSEGWYIEGGKRTWYHFGRSFPCVERSAHIEANEADGFRGPVPGVWS